MNQTITATRIAESKYWVSTRITLINDGDLIIKQTSSSGPSSFVGMDKEHAFELYKLLETQFKKKEIQNVTNDKC